MIKLKQQIAALGLMLCSLVTMAGPLCPNKFPDFVNDVCWSCMFPMKVWGARMMGADGEDFLTTGSASPVCACIESLKAGVPISFWEMAYIVDVHTEPGCLPTLGGLKLDLPWVSSQYGGISERGATANPDDSRTRKAFFNAAYYVSPMMYLLEAVLDDTCSDRSPFNVGWASEFDPTWNDDSLALIKMPISFAFGTIPGMMAGGIDAAAATIGFPINEIFWHAGSWGPMYPLTGNVSNVSSMDQVGSLIATRMLAEAHGMREMASLFGKGSGRSYGCEPGEPGCGPDTTEAVMCAGSPSNMPPQLIMKKRQYKLQRLFPTPYTAKTSLGGCCTPIGRSTILREQMTQLPVANYKDFGYAVFRKRDCCAGVVSPATLK